ncbi:hypothetical protein DDZ13_11530 [Coraliomargarita sinensis]|uniref:Spheroidene monooxygenase n=1 Tax=Coraliomargarita sinensis TaxID=2174842 RepID=A0A317ZE02_9BACT|nr:hypothetical protein [Coraliomargarita sinensis]PXA03604.1 hypothetical protein DDZ13_11530 [Coraliomargarita sinensis]
MKIFSYHLAQVSPAFTLRSFFAPPSVKQVSGLCHMECMAPMMLGAPIVSPERLQLRKLAVFAAWEDESALDQFLGQEKLGKALSAGWHLRLSLIRRWGSFPEFDDFPENESAQDSASPVVAVTIARLKLPEVFRFIRWGRPVEELVRDHPGTTLALASMRMPRTFSTFTVWRSEKEMTNMVHGHSTVSGGERHAAAMAERNRKDFHHYFTTLRFHALSEHGEWDGRRHIVPES